jgi:hypothetical protein
LHGEQDLTKLVAPASDGFVRHRHPALEEQFLDVAQAQLKADVPAHSATDDLGWETMTGIERFRFLHHHILRDRPDILTTPTAPRPVNPVCAIIARKFVHMPVRADRQCVRILGAPDAPPDTCVKHLREHGFRSPAA